MTRISVNDAAHQDIIEDIIIFAGYFATVIIIRVNTNGAILLTNDKTVCWIQSHRHAGTQQTSDPASPLLLLPAQVNIDNYLGDNLDQNMAFNFPQNEFQLSSRWLDCHRSVWRSHDVIPPSYRSDWSPRSHLVLMVLLWPLNTALKYKLELKVPVKKLNIPPRNVVSQGLHLYVFMRETKLVYIKQIVRFIIIIRGKLSTLHVWVLSIKVG